MPAIPFTEIIFIKKIIVIFLSFNHIIFISIFFVVSVRNHIIMISPNYVDFSYTQMERNLEAGYSGPRK